MSHEIITLIGIFVSGVVSLVTCTMTQSKTHALFMYRLEQLEAKVDKHNNVIERTFLIEQSVDYLKEKVNDLKAGE